MKGENMKDARIKLAALAALAVLLTGCGGAGPAQQAAKQPDAPTAGCTEAPTEELYVWKMFECPSPTVRWDPIGAAYVTDKKAIYTFSTEEAKGNWRKAAEGFGAVVTRQGDGWIEVEQ